jgi:hypothetical protein
MSGEEIEFCVEGPNAQVIAEELSDFLATTFGFRPPRAMRRSGPGCALDAVKAGAFTLEAAFVPLPALLLQSTEPEEQRATADKVDRLLRWAASKRMQDPETEVTVGVPGRGRVPLERLRAVIGSAGSSFI